MIHNYAMYGKKIITNKTLCVFLEYRPEMTDLQKHLPVEQDISL